MKEPRISLMALSPNVSVSPIYVIGTSKQKGKNHTNLLSRAVIKIFVLIQRVTQKSNQAPKQNLSLRNKKGGIIQHT